MILSSSGHYSIHDGLSQSLINCIFEDSEGYLWLGTRDGLNRYNGYTFDVFRVDPSAKNSISDNYIRDIKETSNGKIWIATNFHLSVYDKNTHVFRTVKVQRSSTEPTVVYGLHVDKREYVWAKTEKKLVRIDSAITDIRFFDHYSNPFTFVSNQLSYPVMEDRRGMLWTGTKDGLFFFDRDLDLFQRFSLEEKIGEGQDVDFITSLVDYSGSHYDGMLIGTRRGLFFYNRVDGSFSLVPQVKTGVQEHALHVNSILFLDQDKALVATNTGLYTYENMRLTPSRCLSHNNLFLDQIRVFYTYLGEGNLLWLATELGLLKFDLKPAKFELLRDDPDPEMIIPSSIITAIYANDSSSVWLGTRDKGLLLVDVDKRKVMKEINSQTHPSFKPLNDQVYSVFLDSKKALWLGTADGLFVLKQDNTLERFCRLHPNIPCDMFRNNPVHTIAEDPSGNLWFGSNRGLHKFESDEKRMLNVFHLFDQDNAFPVKMVLALEPGDNNDLWIAAEAGLIAYNYLTGEATKFQIDTLSDIASRTILSVSRNNDDLWLGTFHGLLRFDMKTNEFDELAGVNFPNVNVRSIEIDSYGSLWMGTTRGIMQYVPALETCKVFDMTDGTQGYEFYRGSSSQYKDGRIYFGGVDGLNWFHPDKISRNKRRPVTVITHVDLISENQLVKVRPVANVIEIPSGTSVFTIHFSALDFTNPARNVYAYRMSREGAWETSWIQLGNHPMATFTNMPGGQYVFEVKGANNDGVWSDEIARATVFVRAPFYKQRWAYYVYVALSILLMFWLIRYRTKKLIESNRILREKETAAKLIEKQNKELEIKNKDITDSINYAKRIQEAMMPSRDLFDKVFRDAFVLYKPKSIVSGDFFWINKHDDKIFVAAVDCTGHGVPGAFMSLIGIELFRRITVIKGVDKPAQILELLNENFSKMFDDDNSVGLKDGMDLSLCVIDKTKNIVEYAGAFNPLYVVRDNAILEFPAERFSIGLSDDRDRDVRFTNHRLDLQEDDILYLFSDGYADQFGGPDNKKYKKRRFRHLLLNIHQYPLSRQAQLLDDSIEKWKGNTEQIDDILIIGIRP